MSQLELSALVSFVQVLLVAMHVFLVFRRTWAFVCVHRVRKVASEVLKKCTSLAILSLHDNPITMQELREVDGFEEFESRRKTLYDKKIEMDILKDNGFDEGADFM